MGFFAQAGEAISRCDYLSAVNIFRIAISSQPELAWVYKQNISRIRRRYPCLAPQVVLNLCSIPQRKATLLDVLHSLQHQVDVINLYLDRYDSIPDFIFELSVPVNVVLSSNVPGLRDGGKFLNFCHQEDCYYFTVDDDIIYPKNYVERLIEKIEYYGRRAVVGVHGINIPMLATRYFSEQRGVFHFCSGLAMDTATNSLGTGTIAFHSSAMPGLNMACFPRPGMADVHLAIFCRQRYIPMVCVARPLNWLREISGLGLSLFDEFKDRDGEQTELIKKNNPWGTNAIDSAIEAAIRRNPSGVMISRFSALLSTRYIK